MQKLFVPYELALLAKKQGFSEQCLGWYELRRLNGEPDYHPTLILQDSMEEVIESILCYAPLYQQLVDWFREKHDTVINVYANASGYLFEIHDSAKKGGTHRYDSEYTGTNDSGCWDDYYEAFNAAIEKAFTLLSLNQ